MPDPAQIDLPRADHIRKAFQPVAKRIGKRAVFGRIIFQPETQNMKRVRGSVQLWIEPRNQIVTLQNG